MTGYWIGFGLAFLVIPIAIAKFKIMLTKDKNLTKEQEKIINTYFGYYIIFYWLCDFFYMFSFNGWLAHQFVLGGIILIIIFYNLANSFTGKIYRNNVLNIALILDFVVGLALSVYLLYLVPNSSLQSILTTIISAVYGGLITLVGVAWTIRYTKRQDEIKHLERIKPLFYPVRYNELHQKVDINDSQQYQTPITVGCLKNSSKIEFVIVSIEINNKILNSDVEEVIEKETTFILDIKGKDLKVDTIEFIKLNVKDIENNKYSFLLKITSQPGAYSQGLYFEVLSAQLIRE